MDGTPAIIVVAFQFVVLADTPPMVTVLDPWVEPKFVPVIVTNVPTEPEDGDRPEMLGPDDGTVKFTPLLAVPPTITTTFPVVAPDGTAATMLVALQLVGLAVTPLKVTVLDPCDGPKFDPLIVTDVPTGPEIGERFDT